MLIILLIFSSILFMKLLLNRMNRYIDENGKSSMGAVVEQIQQTYELQVNGYYSQLHLVEDYILKEKEVSPETDANQNFFEAWEKEAGSRLVFLQENGKAMTADGTKMRIDIPGKLLLALRNGHNIAKLVAWNYEETQSGGYLVAIPCQEYHMNGEVYTAVGTVYDHSKLDSMLKLKSYNEADGGGVVRGKAVDDENFFGRREDVLQAAADVKFLILGKMCIRDRCSTIGFSRTETASNRLSSMAVFLRYFPEGSVNCPMDGP